MLHDAKWFVKKFKAIPESKWTTNVLIEKGRCCALGHCGVRAKPCPDQGYECKKWYPTPQSNALNVLLGGNPGEFRAVYDINDGNDPDYPQDTPKKRILAALYAIQKGQPK